MNLRKHLKLFVTVAFISASCVLHAADLTGHWTSEFDSQIGPQKYTYDFKTNGDVVTGKATYDHSMGKGEVDLADVKVQGDDVSFTETVNIQGNPLKISYQGKIAGDEMKLTRQVGDFGTENIVAKRAPAASAEKTSPNK
ncbi:MAG TPA: hypothetical protein VIM69_04920 [Opitutaceae bacterium]